MEWQKKLKEKNIPVAVRVCYEYFYLKKFNQSLGRTISSVRSVGRQLLGYEGKLTSFITL